MTLWVTSIVLVVVTVGGLITLKLVERKFVENIDSDLRETTSGMVAAIDVFDLEVIERIRDNEELGRIGTDDYVMLIVSTDGIDFSLPDIDAAEPGEFPDVSSLRLGQLQGRAEEPFTLAGSGGIPDFRLLTAQLPDGKVLVAAASLEPLDRALETVGGVFLLVAVIAAIVLSVIVSFVAGYVTRPISGMIATAERVGTGALDTRIPVDGVDDVARLATAVNSMLDRLEVAFADRAESELKLRRFVADASHELRTPLAAVLGYAQLIQTGMANTPDDVDHAVDRIASEGERMRLLVEELLTLARLDHGRGLARIRIDLADIVTAAVDDATTIDDTRPISMTTTPGDHTIDADAAAVRQAVDNLLANTRVHTPSGTEVSVTLTTGDSDTGGGTVVIHVDDNGPGLDDGDAAHVFDRFFRSERSRSRTDASGGSGLGLSIAQAIVVAHGGRVAAGRSPAGGARFTVELPAAATTGDDGDDENGAADDGRDGFALDAP